METSADIFAVAVNAFGGVHARGGRLLWMSISAPWLAPWSQRARSVAGDCTAEGLRPLRFASLAAI